MLTTATGVVTFIIIVLLLIIAKTVYDAIAKNIYRRVINHKFSAFMMSIFYAILASHIFNGILLYSNWVVLFAFTLALSLQWILFDIFFNLVNGDSLFHVGNTSTLDKFLKRFEPNMRFVIKLVPLAISIMALYLLI